MGYRFNLCILMFLVIFNISTLKAEEKNNQENPGEKNSGLTQRVKGVFKISLIDKKKGFFVVHFTKEITKETPVTSVFIEVTSLNQALKQGEKIYISAEVNHESTSDTRKEFEASQILIHLPRSEGTIKLWLLSRKEFGLDLRGTSFLDMHSPQNDYRIF